MNNGILRTWSCQNARCGAVFDSWDAYPECTTCGCARTNWMPGGGHVSSKAGGIDKELRALCDAFQMTDINNRGGENGGMPRPKTPAAHDAGPMVQFAPGFVGTPYVRDAAGNPHAVCMPSASKVDFKVKAQVGKALSGGFAPGPATNTRIEASTKG